MTNLEAIQFLYANYKRFCKLYPKLPIEVVEDSLSNVSRSLVTVDYDIEDPFKFIKQALFYEVQIDYRKNKKYVQDEEQFFYLSADCIFSQIEEDQELASHIRLMHESIELLPEKQKAAIHYYLKHGKFSAEGGAMESRRTNYKLGLATLRKAAGPSPWE